MTCGIRDSKRTLQLLEQKTSYTSFCLPVDLLVADQMGEAEG